MTVQQYLIGVLAEECSEVATRCSKASRFGLDEIEPGQDLDNRQRIVYELNDIFAMLEMLSENGVLMPGILKFTDGINRNLEGLVIDRGAVNAKKAKVARFMEYLIQLELFEQTP